MLKFKKLIFISGPFRADNSWKMECNIRLAEELAYEVWNMGAVAICPHTNTRYFQDTLPDGCFLEGDLEILKRCDAMICNSEWRRSEGSRKEVDYAKEHNIPIFYDLYDLQFWLEQNDEDDNNVYLC